MCFLPFHMRVSKRTRSNPYCLPGHAGFYCASSRRCQQPDATFGVFPNQYGHDHERMPESIRRHSWRHVKRHVSDAGKLLRSEGEIAGRRPPIVMVTTVRDVGFQPDPFTGPITPRCLRS